MDVEAGERSASQIARMAKKIQNSGVVSGIGGFAGLFRPEFSKFKDPVLVSATDGVGTKLEIARKMNIHNSVGIDLVAMCVNDILTLGAEPLFFLDYISIGKLKEQQVSWIIEGIVEGCSQSNCVLLGGETAEHPGVMNEDDYDLAGFVVGILDNEKRIDGSTITEGDVVIGLASSGLHSNGFSLVRKLIADNNLDLDISYGLKNPLGLELLRPTRIYHDIVRSMIDGFSIKGMAHITGGGLTKNLPRIMPDGLSIQIERDSWEVQPIFRLIRDWAGASEEDFYATFNMGIGYVIVIDKNNLNRVMQFLVEINERAWCIGEVVAGGGEVIYKS